LDEIGIFHEPDGFEYLDAEVWKNERWHLNILDELGSALTHEAQHQ
jgi:hypothetical protein